MGLSDYYYNRSSKDIVIYKILKLIDFVCAKVWKFIKGLRVFP